ncbi:MAG TPA: ATP-binding cassette domain-containing protein [Acidimicrobiales bacterium]|jgi:ABC-2 type transport system ATP-binding protein
MSERAAVLVDGIKKRFGSVTALDGVSFEVRRGTVLGLLGPNGAGKTTAVRILTTLLQPDEGRAEVEGFNVVTQTDDIRKRIGLAGQNAAVDENLTGRENIELVGRLYHLPKVEAKRRAQHLLERFDLADAADRTVRTYSGGMRRRLDLGASLVGEPTVLFLDEPTTGLDPRSRIDLWEIIRQLVSEGTTVLLTTQYLEEADELANRVVVIDHGRVIAAGTPDELKSRVGGDVLEVTVAEPATVRHAAELVVQASGGEANDVAIEAETGKVTVRVKRGARVLADTVRMFDAAGVPIGDLALRKPTLDDVFLTLTGRPAEDVAAAASGSAPAGSGAVATRQDVSA